LSTYNCAYTRYKAYICFCSAERLLGLLQQFEFVFEISYLGRPRGSRERHKTQTLRNTTEVPGPCLCWMNCPASLRNFLDPWSRKSGSTSTSIGGTGSSKRRDQIMVYFAEQFGQEYLVELVWRVWHNGTPRSRKRCTCRTRALIPAVRSRGVLLMRAIILVVCLLALGCRS
jgi:hypothetical protein